MLVIKIWDGRPVGAVFEERIQWGRRLIRQAVPQWLVYVAGEAEILRSHGMKEDEALQCLSKERKLCTREFGRAKKKTYKCQTRRRPKR